MKKRYRKIYYILYDLDYLYDFEFNYNRAITLYFKCIRRFPHSTVYLYENTFSSLITAGYRGYNEKLIFNFRGD